MPNSPKNMREFITLLEKEGEIRYVDSEVSAYLEIAALSEVEMKKEGGGKALFFRNVSSNSMPVCVNLFGSFKRICLAMGVNNIEEIPKRIRNLIDSASMKKSFSFQNAFSIIKDVVSLKPNIVKKSRSQEEILGNADLTSLPILTTWKEDGGPFITLPIVITKSLKDGLYNAGMYRVQVYDEKTAGMHWHRHKVGASHYREYKEAGERIMPVNVVLGGPPALTYASTAPLPPQLDEYKFTSFLTSSALPLVKAKTNSLLVPADAEIVIEGFIDTTEEYKLEGPFGDHTGYYSPADYYPVFHVTAITKAKDALYPATVVGPPPMEDYYLGYLTARVFLPLIQTILPEVVDYFMPTWGVFHNALFISIKKEYPAHARKVANAIWGLGMLMLTKVIVVFDADVNIHDDREALWIALNNIDVKRDVFFSEGPLDELDHSVSIPTVGGKMGIDATVKTKEEGVYRDYPKRLLRENDFLESLKSRFADFF